MPTSHENALQQRCQQIVTSPVLSPEQKRHFLALEAENNLPYPQLPAEARRALDEGVICDMFEGHAPYKPRYVLPDYARFLANGSEWLELEGAKDLDDALSLLTILYHHVSYKRGNETPACISIRQRDICCPCGKSVGTDRNIPCCDFDDYYGAGHS